MRAEELTEEATNMFREYLRNLEENTKFDILREMKAVMDISFGEKNNQIVRPDVVDIARFLNQTAMISEELADRISKSKFDYKMAGWRSQYTILIFFPEINITNTKGEEHKIRELYVRIKVSKEGLLYGSMDGVRTCVTQAELDKKYFHSHLSAFNPSTIGFNKFCLGSGEINLAMSMLRSAYDKINFTLFCLHLKNYVKWESIEGTPYNYIANIETRTVAFNDIMLDVEGSGLSNIVDILYKEIIAMPLAEKRNLFNYSISEKSLIVTQTEELEKLLAKMILGVKPDRIARGLSDLKWMLVIKDTAGDYCRLSNIRRARETIQTFPVLVFKGEPKMFNVIEIKEVKKIENYANPRITETLCWRLSCDFTKEAVRNGNNSWQTSTTGGEHQTSNPNPLSL